MILTKEQFNENLKKIVGERTDDEALQIVQDMTETYADMETKSASATEYENRYKQLDEEWRTKYRDTFFNGKASEGSGGSDPIVEEPKNKEYKYENLFKEE